MLRRPLFWIVVILLIVLVLCTKALNQEHAKPARNPTSQSAECNLPCA
jgi:hypothetical protein